MFRLEIETSNAAFEEDYLKYEVSDIVSAVAERIKNGEREGRVKDVNGNTVGSFTLDTE